jgi:ATP-binding cassette subfamily A (ABC1) protein 3
MADGQLRCVGSSLFLKRTYGVGYNLTTELHGEGDSKADAGQKVEEIVTSEVSEATMLTNVGTEMNFQLPISGSSNFASMLTRLDEEVDKGTVVNYGLGITTLEEVFLLVAHGDENERTDLKASQRDLLKSSESFRLQGQIELEDKVFRRHVAALFRKRAANFKRDKKAWCCTTILPSLFVLTGFLLYTYAQRGRDIGQLDLTLGMFNADVSSGPRNPIPINNDTVFQCQPGKCIYEIPFVTDNTTNESYTFCGYHAYLGPKSACSIEPYDNIINGVDDHGAEKVNAPGTNVSEVSQMYTFVTISRPTLPLTLYLLPTVFL